MAENGVLLVQALYSFSGSNNDELCFKKGDIFVVTQKEEGGWWEGTFSENTGWFPSNYVKEYKISDGGSLTKSEESPPLSPQQSQQQVLFRSMVSKDILESEKNHVTEMQNISNKYLTPLLNTNILLDSEYKQLVGNMESVITVHAKLLDLLEEEFKLACKDQRIGGIFLKMAPNLQAVHKIYISNHPKAVCIIEKYKDELNTFMECQGAARPGTLVLTTALSLPFRRLDKYPGVLQEFQRHIEDAHPDRGDTQRSTHVYRELAASCSSIRRQKQLELEVLTNKVHGFDGGDSLSVLGDVLHMRSVAFLPDNRDRYLVLFPGCLVVLSLSSRASSFIFEGKYQLSLLSVRELEDGSQYKNAFEVSAPHMEPIIAICQTANDQEQWVDILRQNIRNSCASSPVPYKISSASRSPPTPPAHLSFLPSELLFVGRPYIILTKFFARMYRKKVITKQLLRSLNGTFVHHSVSCDVILRRHKHESSVRLTYSMGSSSDHQFLSNLNAPLPRRKEFNRSPLNNLKKWRYQLNLSEQDSFYLTDSSERSSGSSREYSLEKPIEMFKSCLDFSLDSSEDSVTDYNKEKENLDRYMSQSMPWKSCVFELKSTDDSRCFSDITWKEAIKLSPKLDIPSSTFLIPSHVPLTSDDGSSISEANICDRTIYETSSSLSSSDKTLTDNFFLRKSNPGLAYFFSSCSGDEDGGSCGDFYGAHRKSFCHTLSQSEPDLFYSFSSNDNTITQDVPHYASHFVQIVRRVEKFPTSSSCEFQSCRSTDSGVAVESIHRPEKIINLSEQSTDRAFMKSTNINTPDFPPSECDSVLQSSTPCTSASVSCISDSSFSVGESTSVDLSSTTPIYKSGLYAHWWMKASISPEECRIIPKMSSTISTKKESHVRPMHVKASFHSFKDRSPLTLDKKVSKFCNESTNRYLVPDNTYLPRRPSYESQSSQITIIKNSRLSSSIDNQDPYQNEPSQAFLSNESEEDSVESTSSQDYDWYTRNESSTQFARTPRLDSRSSYFPTSSSFTDASRFTQSDLHHNATFESDSSPSPIRRCMSLPRKFNIFKGSPLLISNSNISPSMKSTGKIIKPWSMSCMRPSPPLRPGFMVRDDKRKTYKKKDESWHEDDALILRVIELYCTSSAKARYTVNSIDLGQVSRSCGNVSMGGYSSPLPSCLASTPTSPPLSPFGDMKAFKGGNSNWCCGLAIKAAKKNIDFDC